MKVDLQKALAKNIMIINKCHSEEDPSINDLWKYTIIDNAQYIPFIKIKSNDGIAMSADEKQAHIPIDSNFKINSKWDGNNIVPYEQNLSDTIRRRFDGFTTSGSFYGCGFYGMYWYLISGESVKGDITTEWPNGYTTTGSNPKYYTTSYTQSDDTRSFNPGTAISSDTYLTREDGKSFNIKYSLAVDSDDDFLYLIRYSNYMIGPSEIERFRHKKQSSKIGGFYPQSLHLQVSSNSIFDLHENLLPVDYSSLLGDSWTVGDGDYIVYIDDETADSVPNSGAFTDNKDDLEVFETVSYLYDFLDGKDFFKVSEFQEHRNEGLLLPSDTTGRNFPLLYANEVFVKGSGNSMR